MLGPYPNYMEVRVVADEIRVERATLWRRKSGTDKRRYVVIGNEYTTKDGDAANWSQAIMHQVEDASEPVRIRTVQDFTDKFEPAD